MRTETVQQNYKDNRGGYKCLAYRIEPHTKEEENHSPAETTEGTAHTYTYILNIIVFQTPHTPEVTSGASTLTTCFTKYGERFRAPARYTTGRVRLNKENHLRRRKLQQQSQYHSTDGATGFHRHTEDNNG